MPLTRNQRNAVANLILTVVTVMVLSGLGFVVYTSFHVSYPQHYCSGATGVTVTEHNDGYVTITQNDPSCK